MTFTDLAYYCRYESGDRLSPEHERTILERVLPNHPECEKKIGTGVDYVTVSLSLPETFFLALWLLKLSIIAFYTDDSNRKGKRYCMQDELCLQLFFMPTTSFSSAEI